jgi:Domain of unknown function (DUF4173)
MNDAKRQVAIVAAAGHMLGVLGDLLLRATPWGINVTLWTAAFLVITVVLIRWQRLPVARETLWLFLPVVYCAAVFVWRDSDTLKVLNGLAICTVLALAALRGRIGRLPFGGVMEYSIGLLQVWFAAPPVFVAVLFKESRRHRTFERSSLGKVSSIARGLLISIPLLLIFGKLFMAADAAFEQLVADLFDWDFIELFPHLFWILTGTAIAGGILYRLLLAADIRLPAPERSSAFSLGIIEAAVVLAMLNLLFFGFIVAQFGYFFGGTGALAGSQVLTIASYARRGFFELVTVTLLVLPLLLLLHWLLRPDNSRHTRIFQALAGTLIAMLFVIMASALHRMYLYQDTFGLTELRLYTTAFMGWLALVFLWFMGSVLRGKRERFAFGALVAGIACIALLDGVNPDALIARVNTARAARGKQVDVLYLTTLSADAVPVLINALPGLSPVNRRDASYRLLMRLAQATRSDWRSWNLGASVALDAIRARQPELQAMAAQQ